MSETVPIFVLFYKTKPILEMHDTISKYYSKEPIGWRHVKIMCEMLDTLFVYLCAPGAYHTEFAIPLYYFKEKNSPLSDLLGKVLSARKNVKNGNLVAVSITKLSNGVTLRIRSTYEQYDIYRIDVPKSALNGIADVIRSHLEGETPYERSLIFSTFLYPTPQSGTYCHALTMELLQAGGLCSEIPRWCVTGDVLHGIARQFGTLITDIVGNMSVYNMHSEITELPSFNTPHIIF